jgi:hypothetical protein
MDLTLAVAWSVWGLGALSAAMPITVRADFFWVACEGSTAAQMAAHCVAYVAPPEEGQQPRATPEWRHELHDYLLTNADWHAETGLFCATVWKKHTSDLPSVIDDESIEPLPIDDHAGVGHAMCFCYCPAQGAALVCYSHNGPRHTRLVEAIQQIGHVGPVVVGPVMSIPAEQRLRDAEILRGFEFSIHSPRNGPAAAFGASADQSLDIMRDLGGYNVTVRVTVGHRRTNLNVPTITDLFRRLRGRDEVGSMKMSYSDDVGVAPEWINLIDDRKTTEFQVNELAQGRRMDIADCHRCLRAAYQAERGNLRRGQQ